MRKIAWTLLALLLGVLLGLAFRPNILDPIGVAPAGSWPEVRRIQGGAVASHLGDGRWLTVAHASSETGKCFCATILGHNAVPSPLKCVRKKADYAGGCAEDLAVCKGYTEGQLLDLFPASMSPGTLLVGGLAETFSGGISGTEVSFAIYAPKITGTLALLEDLPRMVGKAKPVGGDSGGPLLALTASGYMVAGVYHGIYSSQRCGFYLDSGAATWVQGVDVLGECRTTVCP